MQTENKKPEPTKTDLLKEEKSNLIKGLKLLKPLLSLPENSDVSNSLQQAVIDRCNKIDVQIALAE